MCATTKQNQTKQEEKEMQDFMYERDTGHDPLTLEKVLDLMGKAANTGNFSQQGESCRFGTFPN